MPIIQGLYPLRKMQASSQGGELPPAATGLGPDFAASGQMLPRHNGLYAMIQVPQKLGQPAACQWGMGRLRA